MTAASVLCLEKVCLHMPWYNRQHLDGHILYISACATIWCSYLVLYVVIIILDILTMSSCYSTKIVIVMFMSSRNAP